MIREHLAGDHDLRHRLELRAATAGDDLDAVRERVLSLLDTRPFARYGYIEYANARSYGLQASEAVSALRTLTGSGHAVRTVDVAREAHRGR
ncbi:hypothetical protein ACFQL8_22215 [Streptomyces goshikiensis]|uniref:hypothetical protein n=1 Tax=Streptomyces goshikiensis TaxID=1942 RepID=UPI00199CC167|nr:hypothetical protein [Streptomyces goshikiensis]GHD60578.1 hypothetical protein GCM10010336_12690 [Streptomyces goshikiensis]